MALSITPIELNGMVGRTQDFSTMKAADDAKVNIHHAQAQVNIEHERQQKVNSVNQKEDSSKAGSESDARSGSRNKYFGDGGKNRRDKDNSGRVVVKGTKGFDISV